MVLSIVAGTARNARQKIRTAGLLRGANRYYSKSIKIGNIIARLRDIGYEIDNLLNDYYNYEE